MITIGIIGYGYWGPNLTRNFFELPGVKVSTECDLNQKRLEVVRSRYPSIKTTTDSRDILNDSTIDAVVIATPVSCHYELAMAALKAGKHVLIEKPMTCNEAEASALIEEAERRQKILLVDHTFLYTGAVRKIKELIDSGEMGDIYYFDSVRVNLGLFQHDVDVTWDLAVHDLSIINYLLPYRLKAVSAVGINNVPGQPNNLSYITLFFEGSLMAHVHVNWLSPVKIRRTLIGGSKKMIVYDDLEPSEKVKVYDKGINIVDDADSIHHMLISYRTGDMWAPKIDMTEGLNQLARHFVSCIESGESPITDGWAGRWIVKVLESAAKSIKNYGQPIELNF